MAGPLPEVEEAAVAAALRRAEIAWRSVVPAGARADALWRHGRRVGSILCENAGEQARSLAAAAALHEIGWFLRDRGHFAIRGARWVAAHLDDVLGSPTPDERRLVGELILFQRHRGELPPDLIDAAAVERFRALDEADHHPLPGPPGGREVDLLAAFPRGALGAVSFTLALGERLRHPLRGGGARQIHRPAR